MIPLFILMVFTIQLSSVSLYYLKVSLCLHLSVRALPIHSNFLLVCMATVEDGRVMQRSGVNANCPSGKKEGGERCFVSRDNER